MIICDICQSTEAVRPCHFVLGSVPDINYDLCVGCRKDVGKSLVGFIESLTNQYKRNPLPKASSEGTKSDALLQESRPAPRPGHIDARDLHGM